MDRGGAREDGIHEEKMGFMKRRWDYEREDGIMKENTGFMKEKMGFMKRRWDL